MTIVSKLKNHHNWRYKPHILTDYSDFYRHREVLRIPNCGLKNGPQLSIMTYNIMGTCSKRRYQYLENHRYVAIVHEISSYDADIVCLQEVSMDKMWKLRERLQKIDYVVEVSRHNNANTMAICYKNNLFKMVHFQVDNLFDTLDHSYGYKYRLPASAMLMSLQFKDDFLKGYSKPKKSALIIVNTHLTSGEDLQRRRTMQTAAIMKLISDYSEKCRNEFDIPSSYVFLAGDLNSTPADPAYLSLVSKPFSYQSPAESEAMGFTELAELHNSFSLRAVSLYSAGYRLVHPSNIGERGEPDFSFWGPHWQGLLDYIFVVCDWSGDDETEVNTLEALTAASGVRLLALLRMPKEENMNGSIPQVGSYPSDHLCMMADIELI